MSHFDDIYEIAADNYGLVSTAQAASVGVVTAELSRYVRVGRLSRIGHGLYRLTHYIPTPFDSYAECVVLVGPEAYLCGESVIALHALAPTNPKLIHVATPKRVRKLLPANISVVKRTATEVLKCYEGIPSQSVFDAIQFCRGHIMKERLVEAAKNAQHNDLVSQAEYDELIREFAQ